MITIVLFAAGLAAVIVAIVVAVGRRGATTNHEGLLVERGRTVRAEADGGIFNVHANHGSRPGVEENDKLFG
ncbi:hypothetical protein [Embleya sp. NBC_00896]|uniref:hypothetical protein n=1 Tax=Embleya sp. NBC_00896 TaxID=2975961 RepID=UPI00386EC498|nr:hypothetical protein OG928_04535 [Embleya sp. NBC_00896]